MKKILVFSFFGLFSLSAMQPSQQPSQLTPRKVPPLPALSEENRPISAGSVEDVQNLSNKVTAFQMALDEVKMRQKELDLAQRELSLVQKETPIEIREMCLNNQQELDYREEKVKNTFLAELEVKFGSTIRGQDDLLAEFRREMENHRQEIVAMKELLVESTRKVRSLEENLENKGREIEILKSFVEETRRHPSTGVPDWEHGEDVFADGKPWNAERVATRAGWVYAKGFVGRGGASLSVNGQVFCIGANSTIHSSLIVPVSEGDRYFFNEGCGKWDDGKCYMALRFYPNK
jgi:hypothetical protein